MSERNPLFLIEDIIKCINHIQLYSGHLSFETFSSNFLITEACLYNIQVIGEAVMLLPNDIKVSNPQIPWTLIRGMRNRLIHNYFGTDLQMVWNVINGELPGLKDELEKIYMLLSRER